VYALCNGLYIVIKAEIKTTFMTPQKITSIFLMSLIVHGAMAQKPVQATASLTNATVYYGYGAELQHSAKATLPAGSQELVISNLSHSIDDKTIQIACPENVVLLSYRFNLNTETIKPSADPVVEKMKDSIVVLNKQIFVTTHDESVQNDLLTRTSRLIEANLTNNPEKTISSTELIKLIDYYTIKVQGIKSVLFSISQKKTILNDSVAAINQRIYGREKLQKTEVKTDGQLVLQVMSATAGAAQFEVSYFTRNAGWLPTYDLRVKTVDNSLKLVYKASVTQSTGIDWKQVKLNLSTGNPNQSSTAPILNAWFVDAQLPVVFKQLLESRARLSNTIQGFSNKSITQSKDGNFDMKEDENFLETNVVQAYTTLTESQLNTSFEIDLPYDIPTDGKAYSVSIKDEMVKAGYKHYAVPKLDADAFLLAEISDWESLNLMPGEANIIMDNVYLGKSFIDPNTIADTINISLGRDKRVAVKRTLVKEFSKSKTKGDSKTDDFTYEVVVKNNKKTAIDILLKDQFPVSQTKEVEVTVSDNGGAEVNDEKGILNWKIKLAPGESKKVRFSYSIKYPKDKKIRNL